MSRKIQLREFKTLAIIFFTSIGCLMFTDLHIFNSGYLRLKILSCPPGANKYEQLCIHENGTITDPFLQDVMAKDFIILHIMLSLLITTCTSFCIF